MLTVEQLNIILQLVVAGGKSPNTGPDAILAAANAITWIQAEITRLGTQ